MENNEVSLLVNDITDNYIIEKSSYSHFDLDLNEKVIIQNGKFVRANNAFLKHYNVSKKELYNVPVEDFLVEINFDNTGLNLTFPEIIKEILNGKYDEINFDFKFSINNRWHSLNALAKKIIFRNSLAVHIEAFRVRDEFIYGNQFFDFKGDLNNNEPFIKTGMGYYEVKEDKFIWTDGIYDILEKKHDEGDSQKNILLDLLYEEDFETINNYFTEISQESPKNNFFLRIKTPKNNTKYIHVYSEGIYKEGYLNRIVYFLKDVTEQKLIEEDLSLLSDSLNMVQSASKIGVFTVTPNGFFWSKGIYDIIERKGRIDDLNHHILWDLVVDENKALVQELTSSYSLENSQINFETRLLTEKNNIKHINCVSRAIFNENGEIISKTGFIQDITEKKTIKDENIQLHEILRIISPKTKLCLVVRNPEEKYVHYDEFNNIFEFKKSDNFTEEMFLENLVDPESFINKFSKFKDDKKQEFSEVFEYRVPLSENIKTIYSYLEHYTINEEDYLIGYCQDISETVKREEDLKTTINEKTILMKEVHHRVKNNLQILNSFLNLEQKFNKNDPDKIVHGIKSYIESLALIHEKAYGSDNVGYVNVKDFLESINSKLCSLFSQINVEFDSSIQDDIFILIDTLTPLSLIVNELTINSIKHAFPEDQKIKKIYNSLHINEEGVCEFIFEDNGVGLPENFEICSMGSLGCTIVTALTSQLDGTFTIMETEKGAKFKFEFPVNGKYIIGGE